MLQKGLAALGLFDLTSPIQKVFQRAIFIDQQSRSLDPDPRRAGHIIDTIPGKRLNIDNPFGGHAEFFDHTVAVDTLVLHRVKHFDPIPDKLHQILVG